MSMAIKKIVILNGVIKIATCKSNVKSIFLI